jgi:hypothetical protein
VLPLALLARAKRAPPPGSAAFGHIEQPIDALEGLQVLEKHLGLVLPRRDKLFQLLHLFRRERSASRPAEALELIEKINATRKTPLVPFEKVGLTKKVRSTWLRRSFGR